MPLEPHDLPSSRPLTRRRFLGGLAGAAAAGTALPFATVGCGGRGGKTVLRYMAWGNPEQLALEKQIAADFTRLHPGVEVHLFMVPGSSYADKLQLMLASRTAPDVMRVDHYYFPSLVRKDYFLPLDGFVAKEPAGFLDDFVSTALDECRYQGRLYALNVLFSGVILYYNKILFTQAGLPDPYELDQQKKWDWDAFVHAATALTERDRSGRPQQFGTSMPGYPVYSSIVWNQGGEFMNSDLTRMILDQPEGIAGIAKLADLRWKYRCAPTPSDSALGAFAFESGKLGMNWDWGGVSPRYRKVVKTFDWDIAPTPSGPVGDASVVKGNQLVIFKESKYPELAWEFVKFMTGPKNEMHLYGDLRRCVPTRKSVENDPRYLETKKPPFQTEVFLDSVRRGRTLPINWRYQEWRVEYDNAMESLFSLGTVTPEQACRNATERVNALLASPEGF